MQKEGIINRPAQVVAEIVKKLMVARGNELPGFPAGYYTDVKIPRDATDEITNEAQGLEGCGGRAPCNVWRIPPQ